MVVNGGYNAIMEEKPSEGQETSPAEDRGGDHAEVLRHAAASGSPDSGWVNTEVAAAGLGVSPRTVRDYISSRKLEAKPQGEGVERRWLVSIDSVQALRESRRNAGKMPSGRREEGRGGKDAADFAAELITSVQDLQYRLGRAEARAEITERAESTLRESLERERERADRADRRAEELERRFGATQEPPDPPETAAAEPERVDTGPATAGSQASAQRPWWRRMFGN